MLLAGGRRGEGGVEVSLNAYGQPLLEVYSFKYLVRILLALNEECLLVVYNLRKVKKKWACLSGVLGQEGADTRTLGTFYRAVVQTVLLFGL